ncbi:uncharacterized protein RB166_002186 [Leptodactylus fuscus]
MGLNAQEKAGSRRLLGLLDTADLLSLAGTVTKKKSTACTKAEAIDTILQNSQSAYELLNRRKVLRDIIAAYLKNEGVLITSKITKSELIQKTLVQWNQMDSCMPVVGTFMPTLITPPKKTPASDLSYSFYFHTAKSSIHSPRKDAKKTRNLEVQAQNLDEIIVNFIEVKDPVTSPSRTNPEKWVSNVTVQQREKVPGDNFCSLLLNISKMSTKSCEKEDRKEQRSPTQRQDPQTVPSRTTRAMQKTESQPANFEATTVKVAATPSTGVTQHKNVPQPLTVRPVPDKRNTKEVVKPPPSTAKAEQDTAQIWPVDCEKFARDFCEWFYPLLNSQNPSSGLQKQDWGPQHFLSHAVLQLTYMADRRKYNGCRNTCSRFLALIQEDNLSFQPNLTRGKVKCERSPKGLVVVTVGGAIMKNKTHWGIFDQVFEIVGNTSGDNWKIRSIDLKILESS